ncbi:MAG: hypothetical protein Q7J05_09410 [Paludibacter sp.]|nr:hypothetical protein [Paludibacter sp.]
MSKLVNASRSWLILLILIGLNKPVSAQISNCLFPSDMESEAWTIKNLLTDATLVFENNAGPDGSKAARIVSGGVPQDGYYVLQSTDASFELLENQYYTLSYWARTSDNGGINITPWLHAMDESKDFPFQNLMPGYLAGNWRKFEHTFKNTLHDSSNYLLKFRVMQRGTIYLDNISLRLADESEIPDPVRDAAPVYAVKLYVGDKVMEQAVYKSRCPDFELGYRGMQSKDRIPLSVFHGRSISWTNFSFEGSIRVEVTVLNQQKVPVKGLGVRILPSRHQIQPVVEDNVVSFTLDKPGQFSVEIGEEGYKNGLMIFANPPETNIPDEHDPAFLVLEGNEGVLNADSIPLHYSGLYFKKGAHDIEVFDIPAHIKNIYLADSAWVYGAFLGVKGSGISIYGRGVLSQAKLDYRQAHGIDIKTDSARVEGIVIADYTRFALRLIASENEISWVKVIGGWVYNCDGITAYANSTVKNCFIWANDDAIKVYLSNITWSDIVVWQLNNGGVIQMSWGRSLAENCHISRVDILRAEWIKPGFNAALLSCVGNHYQEPDRFSAQTNWIIEDVVTENPVPIIFGINPNSSSVNHVRNIVLRNWNVQMEDGTVFRNRILNGHPETIIDGFVFENFKLNDTLLDETNWLKQTNWEVKGFDNLNFIK